MKDRVSFKVGNKEWREWEKVGRAPSLTDVLEDEDDEEWRDQVVDALHVAAGRMPDGPDEQNPLKYLQQTDTSSQSKTMAYGREATTSDILTSE